MVGAMDDPFAGLGEDLVLLAISPRTGFVRTSPRIAFALMGSELVRLAASGRVMVQAGRLVVQDGRPTGDAELDAALASIAQARKPPRANDWVAHSRKRISTAYLNRLAAAGCVVHERGIMPRWRITDGGRLAIAQARLDAVARSEVPPDLAHAALGGLVHAVGLDIHLYRGRQNRDARVRLRQLGRSRPDARQMPADPGQLAAEAGVRAATEAAVRAATQAAVQAAVDAAVGAAAASGAHGGHAAHGGGH